MENKVENKGIYVQKEKPVQLRFMDYKRWWSSSTLDPTLEIVQRLGH